MKQLRSGLPQSSNWPIGDALEILFDTNFPGRTSRGLAAAES